MEKRKFISQMLLQQHERKSFWHRMVTGGEKWVYVENPKRTKSRVDPGRPSTSTARPNRFGKKILLCVWWDQEGVVYYALPKPGETVNPDRYRQQIINLNPALTIKPPECARRHGKGICFMMTHHHTLRNQLKTREKVLPGKCEPTRRVHQPLLPQIPTCSDRRHTHFLSSLHNIRRRGELGL
uniref:Transposase n=1 Tax=Myotis myotis TaxID=51298 RepID=A0A7J7QZ14_MYOMY|nr:hypothetical protein mMyoMyo1_011259 [Myotis myotis]